jgi:hypothetical protein
MNLAALIRHFELLGFAAKPIGFWEINMRGSDFKGVPVCYTSSEDHNLAYRSYIEDIILGLQEQGAILLPAYKFLRAHHNKVFMEVLRDIHPQNEVKQPRSQYFGSYEEFTAALEYLTLPLVLKPADGARSDQIVCVRTMQEALKEAKKISFSPISTQSLARNVLFHLRDRNIDLLRRLKASFHSVRRGNGRTTIASTSKHRRKFVAQEFVPGLSSDMKILVYGKKLYCLHRDNRPDDFRASGSGIFKFATEVDGPLLNFAEAVASGFQVPHMSLDVGYDGRTYYLFEFQFLHFGNVALEKSSGCFMRRQGIWQFIQEAPDLEREYARSVVEFLNPEFGKS